MGFIDINIKGLATDQYESLKYLITYKSSLIMGQFEDLQAASADLKQTVTDLQTSVDAKQDAIAKAIADLEAKVAQNPDLQPIIDDLKATAAAVKAAKDDVDSTPTA